MNVLRVPIYLALSIFLTSSTALCGDGVIEINMARVKAGGATASDAPGFPVTLDQRGAIAPLATWICVTRRFRRTSGQFASMRAMSRLTSMASRSSAM